MQGKKKIQYSVTEEEHKGILKHAKRRGLSPSAYSKSLVFRQVFQRKEKRSVSGN